MKEFFACPYMIPIRSEIDSCEFRKQEKMNIGTANFHNVMIMSEKSKEMFENSC